MSKIYSQRFYPNPFRYRKLKTNIDQNEIFEEVTNNLQPFLTNKFSLIGDYIDEFGSLKSELKLIRILREKIRITFNLLKSKPILLSKHFDQTNNFDEYQKNLRYLELPLQPLTDKKGFEVQFLSNELLEDAIEEIDDGFTYIYDYCSKMFPESTDLWTDYALLNPKEFPFISHDSLLESTYEIFDKIFDNLQKNSVNLFTWVISGDFNTRLLKVIKPKIEVTKVNYLFILLESLLSLTLFLMIIKYVLSNSKSLLILKNQKLGVNNIRILISEVKKDLNFKKFRFKQKSQKLKSKVLNFKTNLKYKIVKIVVSKTVL